MNELTIRFLCSDLINDDILARLLTFWLALLHSPSTCSSKVSLISIFIPQKLFTERTWKLVAINIHLMIFFITKKKVKFIWVHFHTVIPKPQSKASRHTLNFINYFQLWTTHCKWSVIICITYSFDTW